jgi:RNase P subunit RPR2
VTPNLSHAGWTLRRAMSTQIELEAEMNDVTCPWCETNLVLSVDADEQTCEECGTTWTYEEEEVFELPLAA